MKKLTKDAQIINLEYQVTTLQGQLDETRLSRERLWQDYRELQRPSRNPFIKLAKAVSALIVIPVYALASSLASVVEYLAETFDTIVS